jgi:hypothetical protein
MLRRKELAKLVEEQAARMADIDGARAKAMADLAAMQAAMAAREARSRRRVIVNLKTGEAFDGVVWRWTPGVVELKGAKHHVPGADVVTYDGITIVLEPDVDFILDPDGD